MSNTSSPQLLSAYDPTQDPIYGTFPLRPRRRQTRRVLLLPGHWDDKIECRLEVIRLGEKPKFEAISYVWGEANDFREVWIDGHSHTVTANLESALRRFRKRTEVREIWADAISINQKDKQERNQQVTLMRDIYRQCTGVLIWLGNKCQDGTSPAQQPEEVPCCWLTDFALADISVDDVHPEDKKMIDKYHDQFKRYYRRPKHLRHNLKQDYQMGSFCLLSLLAQDKCLNNIDIPLFLAHVSRRNIVQELRRMMDQSWWGRQWVIQETVLAPKVTVYYGRYVVPWEMLTVAAKKYQVHRQTCCADQYAALPPDEVGHVAHFARTIRYLDNWRQIWWQRGQEPEIFLLPLLWQFRRRSTTHIKDKVYALLPLVTRWGLENAMFPHYEWSDEEVYLNVAEELIKVHDSLLVLMGTTEKSDALRDKLPSWVPDWTIAPDDYELERLDRALLYNASEGESPDERVIHDHYLELNGCRYDVVSIIGETMPEDDDLALQRFKEWHDIVSMDDSPSARYISGCTRREAYFRTLCMDTVYVGKETDDANLPLDRRDYERAGPSYIQEYEHWVDDGKEKTGAHGLNTTVTFGHLDSPGAVPAGIPLPSALPRAGAVRMAQIIPARGAAGLSQAKNIAVTIDMAVTSATTNRRFFLTEQGYMGLGPTNMQIGDAVYVLCGGNTPFLLRSAGAKFVPDVGQRECQILVGDCYVHGIMDGEAMDTEKEKVYLM